MTRSVLAELDAVLAIARLGSFRAAALDLGMSTTALSNSIAKLEQRLGIRMFNRTTRSVSLTEAGKTFVERVGPAVTDIHDAMCWFPRGTEPVFPPRSEPPLSMVF
jgi:DNA-binding transcriptional LysR family regulator